MEQQEIQQVEEEVVSQKNQETEVEANENRKMKNMFSLVILLGGLFVGSLFVDIIQLAQRSGFSERVTKQASVLQSGGKTWVAYSEAPVHVQVVTDASCGEKCSPNQALVWLRRVMPTLVATPVDAESVEGKVLVEKSGVISLPAFIFSNEVTDTDLYLQAETIFTKQDEHHYVLNTQQLGIPAGKFLALPEVGEGALQKGPKDAKVTLVEYSDFQCPYCRAFHPVLKEVMNEYKDTVSFVYKHLPLSFHAQANNAALASECANEQGKFAEYSDMLFARQDEWSKMEGTQRFKDYAARTGMKVSQFSQCLDSGKYIDKVTADSEEARKFGVSGTPGMFVNDQFISGVVDTESLKKVIEEQLAK